MPKGELGGVERQQDRLTAIPLMQIASGFWASKTLAAALDLNLFTKISGSGVDVHKLGKSMGIHPRPAEMLLSACASLGLLEKRKGRFYNSALAQEFLVRSSPNYFGGFITMLDQRLYLPWNRLTEAIKSNKAQTWGNNPGLFEAISKSPGEQGVFTEAMHSIGVQSGKLVAESFDFSRHTQLLDVGGGSGAYCIEAARRYPHLRAVVFDIPAALAIAQEKIAQAGLSDRIRTQAGDFFREELPRGSDVILLSMILHDWGPEKDRMILQKCFDALPSGGAIIVSELIMDDDKTGPIQAALMSMNMLIETEGRNYTWAEYTEWLEGAGFRNMRRIPIASAGANGTIVGHKP